MENIKKFEDFLDRMQGLLDNAKRQGHIIVRVEDLENTFPELKEPEDERIRKAVIEYFRWNTKQILNEFSNKKALAWLEKQGQKNPYSGVSFEYNGHAWGMCARDGGVEIAIDSELKAFVSLDKSFVYPNCPQKILVPQSIHEAVKEEKADNANKVEPKFKVGDYVVDNCGYLWRVEGVINQFYILEGIDGGESRPTIEWVNKTFHLWDITRDAKDGDVLAVDNMIFIYKRTLASHIVSYCKLINDIFEPFDDARTCCEGNPYVHPATKEQREQLEKAMADAGCTFDFEKKELREIESRQEELTEFEKSVKQVMEEAIECGDTHNLKADANMLLRLAQTPAWSEEDEKTFEYALDMVEWYSGKNEDKSRLVSDWLKSLKERVQPQPKQEWNEEDEMIALSIEQVMNCASLLNIVPEKIDKIRTWLKSLKDRVLPQQEWSDEDERKFSDILALLRGGENCHYNTPDLFDFLKSLKVRVGNFDNGYKVGFSAAKYNQWKPSDEQMERLKGIINSLPYQKVLFSLYQDLLKLK